MKWISKFIIRRARPIFWVGLILGIAGAFYSALLYMNLRTDILELLPTEARSVVDVAKVTSRLESIDNLVVLVFSDHPVPTKKFVNDLAKELQKAPPNVIAGVEYKIDRELKFFKDHQALYIDLPDLIKIRDYIKKRISYEKELYNPLNIFSQIEIPEPQFDFPGLTKKYESKASGFDRLPGGYYATPDEKIWALQVNLPGSGIVAQKNLQKAVQKAIQHLNPQTYSPDIVVRFSGGVQDSIEEQDALVEDLETSTIVVTLLVLIGMWVFYRSFRATAALMISLFIGTFWTFGVSYFVVGYLNANSAFLGSIVIGNGINFGVIYLARYMEERRRNCGPIRASTLSLRQTATSTWTAALAAGLSYGSLMLTGFRGFKQFGIIGLIGMVLCWLSAYTVLPALLLILDRKGTLVRRKSPKAFLTPAIAHIVGRFPLLVCGVSMGATLLSLMTFSQLNKNILETDLNKLRNKESMEHGSAYLTRYVDEIFQRYLSPLVILPKSRENARKIAAAFRDLRDQQGQDTFIGAVQTLDDFIPTQQKEKIEVLKQIKNLLPPRLLRRLSKEDQKKVHFLLKQASLKPMTQADLPALLISKFTEKDGSVGKIVKIEPPLKNNLAVGENLIRFIDTLRETADSIEPGAPLAGQLAISSDMIRAIIKDGPKATISAFISVVILVIFLFKNIRTISLVLFALILGVVWLAGIILGFGLKINFLNFIALPITFGIGVDYGVNIFQRYRELRGKQNILYVIRTTGSAVGLSSFSTIVGYTSLLIAGNQGFVSFGLLAVAGEVTCVIAAVVALPAFLTALDRLRRRNFQ